MFKVNNKDTIFIINFEYISHLVLVFRLLTLRFLQIVAYGYSRIFYETIFGNFVDKSHERL